MSTLEMIADANGKLEKLNKRSSKIYVEYLTDWPRQQNFIKKLQRICFNYFFPDQRKVFSRQKSILILELFFQTYIMYKLRVCIVDIIILK